MVIFKQFSTPHAVPACSVFSSLQRAFKLAGAQSVLMSLWSVDDKATSELMIEFYKGLLTGKEPDDALVEAQRALRTKGYSPDKWAAFVLLN